MLFNKNYKFLLLHFMRNMSRDLSQSSGFSSLGYAVGFYSGPKARGGIWRLGGLTILDSISPAKNVPILICKCSDMVSMNENL